MIFVDSEPRRDGDGPGGVEVTRRRLGATLRNQAGRQGERDQRHRDVHPEHPLPSEAVGEDAAEEHPGRSRGARDRAPGAEGLVALRPVPEQVGDDGERRRRDDRRAEALRRARRDQLPLVVRESRQE
jgi:hypothetical protein